MVTTAWINSPVGRLLLAAEGERLCGLWIEGQKYFAATLTGPTEERPDLPVFEDAARWLGAYFAGQKPDPNQLPLAPQGSAFRRVIWALLCEIPCGALTTYGDLAAKAAARLGRVRLSAQAVGGAVGHNPISIIIPCHRVVGADGSLTGYAGGLAVKRQLLALEGADPEEFARQRAAARRTGGGCG